MSFNCLTAILRLTLQKPIVHPEILLKLSNNKHAMFGLSTFETRLMEHTPGMSAFRTFEAYRQAS